MNVNKLFSSPLSISLLSSVGIYTGFRLLSDNGRELTMIKSSADLNSVQSTPSNGSMVKMQGIVGNLSFTEHVDTNQFTSGQAIQNDVQFHPVLASRSSFAYSKAKTDEETGEYVNEYDNDNKIMAYIFEVEEKGVEKYESKSQWIVARPGFSAQALEDIETDLGFYDFIPTSHRVYDLDVDYKCYLEYPEDGESSVYSVETTLPFTYTPPQNKEQLLAMLVNQGVISCPKNWDMVDLMDNVKAHVIHRTRPIPMSAGRRVRITEGFIKSGDKVFLCGELVSGSEVESGGYSSQPVVPGVKCKLFVNGKGQREYSRELHREIITDTATTTGTLAIALYGLKAFGKFI